VGKCECGCDYEAHLWDINPSPEGEPDLELLGCRGCGDFFKGGEFLTDCPEYKEASNG